MKNIVAATFQPGYTTAKVLGLWQYDYGQILRIQGLELPDAVEIHFSLQEKGGESERQVGLTRDGVTEVAVPNSYLENAGTSRDYSIYAFLYISDGKSGNTEYKITMYVQSRPEPKDPETPEDPKDDPFGKTIEAVNKAMESTKASAEVAADSAKSASESATRAEKSAVESQESAQAATTSEKAAATSATAAAESESRSRESATIARSAADQAAKSATAAAESATTATQQAANAAQSATNAAQSATNAARSAESAKTAADAASKSASSAQQASRSAAESASTATAAAQTATTAAGNAAESVTSAAQSAETAGQKATAAETSANNAAESATEAGKSATAAGDSASAAKTSETAAGEAAQTAQEQAERITDSAEQIEKNKAGVAALEETKADKTTLAVAERKLDALWKLNQGVSYQFEEDSAAAYQKTVPSGAKLASIKTIGGRTIVWNQLVDFSSENITLGGNKNGKADYDNEKKTVRVTLLSDAVQNYHAYLSAQTKFYKDHKYFISAFFKSSKECSVRFDACGKPYLHDQMLQPNIERRCFTFLNVTENLKSVPVYPNEKESGFAAGDWYEMRNLMVFNLTQMFGAGNEPSTPEEFEAMFPSDYYPYNSGGLMSAPVNEVTYSDTKNQETSYPIPQDILNLPGYGWSAGDVRNEVDWENKQYIQRVGAVDLGTLNWKESGDTQRDGNSTYKSDSLNTVIRRYSTYSANSICEKFNIVKTKDISRNEYEYSISNNGTAYPLQFTVKSTFCTDENDFKNKINGIMLYYELAEPIVTDISDIIGDTFQEPFEVEAGGTLTFKNSNGDGFQIPVPSEEEYIVSLTEVGGVTE